MNEKQNTRGRGQGAGEGSRNFPLSKARNQNIHSNLGHQTTRDVRLRLTNRFFLMLKAFAREGEVVREKTKASCYIDDYNLKVPKLKLEQVLKNGLPTGPPLQYRLKPADHCEPQVCHTIKVARTSFPSFLTVSTLKGQNKKASQSHISTFVELDYTMNA